MKPEAQRIAIAEACGWTLRPGDNPSGKRYWNMPDGCFASEADIPAYPTDLNAMHEAEKVLTEEEWRLYANRLASLCSKASHATWYTEAPAVIHVTAAQRAEAFLKTIGKWDDSP